MRIMRKLVAACEVVIRRQRVRLGADEWSKMGDVTIFVLAIGLVEREERRQSASLCLLLCEGSMAQNWSSAAGFRGHCVLFGFELGVVVQENRAEAPEPERDRSKVCCPVGRLTDSHVNSQMSHVHPPSQRLNCFSLRILLCISYISSECTENIEEKKCSFFSKTA